MSHNGDEAEVRARAYQLWEEDGCVRGNHEEHWRRAEAEGAAAGTDEAAPTHGGEAASPGLDGEMTGSPIAEKPALRRWPPPIVEI